MNYFISFKLLHRSIILLEICMSTKILGKVLEDVMDNGNSIGAFEAIRLHDAELELIEINYKSGITKLRTG